MIVEARWMMPHVLLDLFFQIAAVFFQIGQWVGDGG